MNAKITKIASLLATLTAAVSLAGCVIDAGPGVVYTDPGPVAAIPEVVIDPGAQMSLSPGDGVGLFVEYAGAGRWDLTTTCDTAVSGAACNFDVVVSSDAYFSGITGMDGGSVSLQDDGSLRLVTDTSFGTDGMSFEVAPGATIEVDVLLDGVPQPQFIFAVSDGIVLKGMPGNPVDFTPAAP